MSSDGVMLPMALLLRSCISQRSPIHHSSPLPSHNLGLSRRGPSRPRAPVQGTAAVLDQVSSCTPYLSSRSIHNDLCPMSFPLLARAGALLCEPPETVGKVAWAGLRRRLGSRPGASFVCMRTSEESQPTAIYVDIDQYLIRPVPGLSAHAHCTTHASANTASL